MAGNYAVYHFTLECVGRCERNSAAAEYWLRMAAHALTQAGFAMDDAMALGIDGGPGASLDFPDPAAPVLQPPTGPNGSDMRRLSTEGHPFR